MPPLAFTWAAHRSYPFFTALPGSAKSPVSDIEAPMTSGDLLAEADVVVLGVELELQAASTTIETSAETPNTAELRLRKRLLRAMTDPP